MAAMMLGALLQFLAYWPPAPAPCPEALRWRELDAACAVVRRTSRATLRAIYAHPACVAARRAGEKLPACNLRRL